MASGIFSTYRQGENRVTSSILAVLRSLAIHRSQRILMAMLGEMEEDLFTFQDQPKSGGDSVPDAEIGASFRVLIETKTTRSSVVPDQVHKHLERLDGYRESLRRLIVLTPDAESPLPALGITDEHAVWCNFETVNAAISEILEDATEVVSEREAFLLRELQYMLEEDRLLPDPRDTVVVAATKAFKEYQRLHAYFCQPGRSFRSATRFAFYCDSEIKMPVPKVVKVRDNVARTPGQDGELGQLIDEHLRMRPSWTNPCKVVWLSAPDSPETIQLNAVIENDVRDRNGRITAFTQGQRYVRSDLLRQAKATSDLI